VIARITGVGLVTPLGPDAATVWARLAAGAGACAPDPELAALPCHLSARAAEVPLHPWLLRRKDRKLLSRAAELALAAAGPALGAWAGQREALGLFVGVGREPPDTGSAEPALAASCVGGHLDPSALAGPGRALYPPLLPLLTLPNLVLSHVSINLGIRGPNGTVAGEAAAGLGALAEAAFAVAEGSCPAALAGGADSRIDFGSARDLYRLGRAGPARVPAEGAVFLLVEPPGSARAALATIVAIRRGPSREPRAPAHRALTGDLGAADGLLDLALAVLGGRSGTVVADDDEGARIEVDLAPPPPGGRDTLRRLLERGEPS